MTKPSEVLSVKQLLERLTSDNAWKLSNAQRAFEWDKLRITNLVDSLLRSFPIGSLLLVESKAAYYELDPSEKLHELKEGDDVEHIQILDGQQRCLALMATFGGKGFYDITRNTREFLWINVSMFNYEYKEFDQKRGQKYFFHWSMSQEINGLKGVDRRVEDLPPKSPDYGWISFYKLVEMVASDATNEDVLLASKCKNLEEIDNTLAILYNSIGDAINVGTIPVHYVSSNEFGDLGSIFHVFIRKKNKGQIFCL